MKNIKAVDLKNCVTSFHFNEQPILIRMPNINSYFVAVFSTVEKLEEEMIRLGIKDYKIKYITNTMEFASSIFEENVRIMLDPYGTDHNTTKWIEVIGPSFTEMN